MFPADESESPFIPEPRTEAANFRTTLWTEVLAAGDQGRPGSEGALAHLCQTYWRPVYAYLRRRTPSREQAQDLTQGFFERLLEKGHLAHADPARGRFRTFLLTSVENFLRDQWDRATALKRGGGKNLLSLDFALGEEELEPATHHTPQSAFEWRWARTLLDRVMARLVEEYRAGNHAAAFAALHPHLWGEADPVPYDQLARQLGLTPVNLRVIAHRVRHRYRELLRDEIAQTVDRPDEVDREIQYLLQLVSG